MDPASYKGKIVKAKVSLDTGDPLYRLRGTITSGETKGDQCYIIHKGVEDLLDKEVLIRLDIPPREGFGVDMEEGPYVGSYISSRYPDGFESALSNQVILYGPLGTKVPTIREIANVYAPGFMPFNLHYSLEDGKVIPYFLSGRTTQMKVMQRNKGRRGPRSIGYALRNYLSKMNKGSEPYNPRVVTFDKRIGLEQILSEFREEKIREKGILWHIEMDPQR